MDSQTLEIGILGPLRVVVNATECQITSRKQRMLLAELALRRGQAVSRDDVLARLWPDSDEEHARDSLRHALWRLRSQLNPAEWMLGTQGDALLLDEHVRVDLREFDRLAASDDPTELEAALHLYRGDLCRELEGYDAEVERERLRSQLAAAGRHLAALKLNENDPAGALRVARQVLQHDPYREEAHRHALEALASMGDPAGVARHFRRLQQTLRNELGVEPSEETRNLYARVAQRSQARGISAPVRQPQAEPPTTLIGRRDEYRQLVEALIDAIETHGRVVHVTGEAGVGKTHLLDALVRTASEHGLRVITSRGVGAEGQLGYQLWIDALRSVRDDAAALPAPWPGVLAALLPEVAATIAVEPGSIAPQLERTRLFEGVARLLNRVAELAPLLVILDDLHSADEDAIQLLHYVARTLRHGRIAIVTAARPPESGARRALTTALTAMRSARLLTELRLKPLTKETTAELLSQAGLAAHTAGILAPRMFHWTGGNPFFILETTRALVEQGSLSQGAESRLEWMGPLPGDSESLMSPMNANVRETILGRVDMLPDESRRLLTVAAVVGKTFHPGLLATVASRDEIDVVEALSLVLDTGLLAEQEVDNLPVLAFSHDLVREAVYQQQPAVMRAAIHRRIAGIFEGSGMASATVAHHFAAAGEVNRAVEHWLAAGDAAERLLAHEEALRAYGAALNALPDDAIGRRVGVLEAIAQTHLHRGAVSDSIDAYDRALTGLDGEENAERRASIQAQLALACGRHYGHHAAARGYAEDAVEYYRAHGSGTELSSAYLGLAYMQYQSFEPAAAEVSGGQVLKLSREFDLPHHEAAALQVITWSRWLAGESLAKPDAEAMERLVAQLGDDEEVSHLSRIAATHLLRQGSIEAGLQSIQKATATARRVGSLRSELLALEILAEAHCYRSDTANALEAAEQALTLASRLEDGPAGVSLPALQFLATAHWLDGNDEAAMEATGRLVALAQRSSVGERVLHLSTWLEAHRALVLFGASGPLPDMAALEAERPVCKTCDTTWLIVAGQAQALSGQPDSALQLAQELQEQLVANGSMLHRGWTHHIRSIALRQLGQIDEAQRQSEMAIHRFQEIGHAWGLAAVRRTNSSAGAVVHRPD